MSGWSLENRHAQKGKLAKLALGLHALAWVVFLLIELVRFGLGEVTTDLSWALRVTIGFMSATVFVFHLLAFHTNTSHRPSENTHNLSTC